MTDQELIVAQQNDIQRLSAALQKLYTQMQENNKNVLISKEQCPYDPYQYYFYFGNGNYVYRIYLSELFNCTLDKSWSWRWYISAMYYIGHGVNHQTGYRSLARNIFSADDAILKVSAKIARLEKKGEDASDYYKLMYFIQNNSYGVNNRCDSDTKGANTPKEEEYEEEIPSF